MQWAGGRDAAGLEPLLRHLQHHMCDPRHIRLLVDVAHRVLDMYGGVVSGAHKPKKLFEGVTPLPQPSPSPLDDRSKQSAWTKFLCKQILVHMLLPLAMQGRHLPLRLAQNHTLHCSSLQPCPCHTIMQTEGRSPAVMQIVPERWSRRPGNQACDAHL